MRLAVTVHRGRVSPLLDTARLVMLVDLVNGNESSRTLLALTGEGSFDRIDEIVGARPDMLVCGTISNPALDYLSHKHLQLCHSVTGNVDEVLECLLAGERLPDSLRTCRPK